jgi:hypothetical protein
MPTIVIIALVVLSLFVVLSVVWSRNRASTNFNLVYIRALRIEKSKEVAIGAALRHLKSFLKPFDQLSEPQIDAIANIFCQVDDPKANLQPVLEHSRKTGRIDILTDPERLKEWRQKLQAKSN